MICPYRREVIVNDKGGYKEVFNPCLEIECPYHTSVLVTCCWKVTSEIEETRRKMDKE